MKALNIETLHSIHGGETTPILTPNEIISVYFSSAMASNLLMSAMGVSPLYSFPISLFFSPIPVYFYAEAKKNPA